MIAFLHAKNTALPYPSPLMLATLSTKNPAPSSDAGLANQASY